MLSNNLKKKFKKKKKCDVGLMIDSMYVAEKRYENKVGMSSY